MLSPKFRSLAPLDSYAYMFNPFLNRLFLDHDIIFYFEITLKKFKKKLSKVLNTFKNIQEKRSICSYGANAPFSIIFQIHDISKTSKGVISWSKLPNNNLRLWDNCTKY